MDCKTKTEILRERYKEYLKPIDPLRPLGHEPADLMPPPGKIAQTCFGLKEHFPRGEVLIRTLGKRTMLDRLEEYKRFQVPLQCPCESIIQGGDPARKKKRSTGPSKPKRVKNELNTVCSVKNLPLPEEAPGKEKLGTIEMDRDISQRKYIRAKTIEVQEKSMLLQQKMMMAPANLIGTSQKKRLVKDGDLCGRTATSTLALDESSSLPISPGRSAKTLEEQLPTIPATGGNSWERKSMPTAAGQPLDPTPKLESNPGQQKEAPTAPTIGSNSGGQSTMPFFPRQPLAGRNSMPTSMDRLSVPEPSKLPSTPIMGRNPNGLNSVPITPGQPFVPQQTNVLKTLIIRANLKKAVVPPQKQPPISIIERRNTLPILPASDPMQLPTMPTVGSKPTHPGRLVVPPQKVPISIGGNSSGQNSMASFPRDTAPNMASKPANPSKLVIPPQMQAPMSTTARRNPLPILAGQQIAILPTVGSQSTLPRNPVVPPKKRFPPTPSAGESLCGIVSKPTHPRRPVVPPRKQPISIPNMDRSSANPASAEKSHLPQPKAHNTSGLNSMPNLGWLA